MSDILSHMINSHGSEEPAQGTQNPRSPNQRQGPAPLQMHLFYGMSLWLGAIPFWPLLLAALDQIFSNKPDPTYENFRTEILPYLSAPFPRLIFLQLEIAKQAISRLETFLYAIQTYQFSDLIVEKRSYTVLDQGQWGSTTLRDYGGSNTSNLF